MKTVLDASALMAYVFGEVGRERIEQAFAQGAVIHIVNWAEVLSKCAERGIDPETFEVDLARQGVLGQTLSLAAFFHRDPVHIARLRPLTRALGLGLGDRACLALGERLGVPILTTDKVWSNITLKVPIEIIR